MSLFSKFKSAVNQFHRKSINRQLRKRLQNHGMSVLSSNCVGAFILHDLNEPFHSPFVNLFMKPCDFIRYLQNMSYYHQQTLEFKPTDKAYPVGWVGGYSHSFYALPQCTRSKSEMGNAFKTP